MNGFIHRQAKQILNHPKYAFCLAVLLVLVPYAAWLSLSVVAFVTLKKGWREGILLLMPVMTAYFARTLMFMPTLAAVINTLIVFLPFYGATCVLGKTARWQMVAVFFGLLAACCAMILQWLMPEFILAQYRYVSVIMQRLHPELFHQFIEDLHGVHQQVVANYLFGLQLVGVVFSSILPMLVARSLQSKLYYPIGFQREMRGLRSSQIGLLIGSIVAVFATQNSSIAMNLLPLFVFYFLLAGLSLSAYALREKRIKGVFLLLLVPILITPFIAIPVYVVLGSLDGLFNLRLYLAVNAGKTT